jgi:hypothetical protein
MVESSRNAWDRGCPKYLATRFFSRGARARTFASSCSRPSLLRVILKGYRVTTLDAAIAEWDSTTSNDGPGVSFSTPQKIKFLVTMREAPKPCSNPTLEVVLLMMDFAELVKQVSVTHCVVSHPAAEGRWSLTPRTCWCRDRIPTPRSAAPAEIYADFLAFQVDADRSRNSPIMPVNRFERQGAARSAFPWFESY